MLWKLPEYADGIVLLSWLMGTCLKATSPHSHVKKFDGLMPDDGISLKLLYGDVQVLSMPCISYTQYTLLLLLLLLLFLLLLFVIVVVVVVAAAGVVVVVVVVVMSWNFPLPVTHQWKNPIKPSLSTATATGARSILIYPRVI